MKKLLIVVDMQNDFIDGALGAKEAVAIVPNVVNLIKNWDGDVVATQDTHDEDYMDTREGRYLPVPHCVKGTDGWKLNKDVESALKEHPGFITTLCKSSFGSLALLSPITVKAYDYIEFCGLCTGICVLSNALIVKNAFPETDVAVNSKCCACVTPDSHETALNAMRLCQIDIL